MDASTRLPLRLLVVEDHRDNANLLSLLLGFSGHEVTTVHDGPSGLEAIRSGRFDVALLDIGLPRMDGYAVALAIATEMGVDAPSLVAYTGHGQAEHHARSLAAGFCHHLVKPSSLGEILDAVAEAGSRRPAGVLLAG